MDQEIKNIPIKDLVLWTENPRDPINRNATDQEIIDRALEDKNSKWTLSKLAKEMGPYYDFSELPTVVFHGEKPIVYDGNRRIALGKIKHGLVSVENKPDIRLPNFPENIPCNVCEEEIALKNVYRKHSDTGSWKPLERDIFLHKFMRQEKSTFLILDEETGIIRANPYLNQRFVKEEIFRDDVLKELGFVVNDGKLHSVHSREEGVSVLSDVANKIKQKEITTRKKRGKVAEVLEPSSQAIIAANKQKKFKPANITFDPNQSVVPKKRQTRRTFVAKKELFGGKLYLRMGEASNLYRDIADLYQFYISNKESLSGAFPCLIRMSLRLLCEIAANDVGKTLDRYLKGNFSKAKSSLGKDLKTTLSVQNVTEQSIVQLLHTGAHYYESSGNIEQTIAISIIVGAILTETHGKDN